MAVLSLAVGHRVTWIGRLKFRGSGRTLVLSQGSLVGGGSSLGKFFSNVPVSDQARNRILFSSLPLSGIGYSVGPSFLSESQRRWMARWALLGVFVPVIGLLTAIYGCSLAET